ncbi:DUF3040 domain-containing protein [Streptomyces sp.]|uniref:DUF3040 domain-containing protein n=1 Tax=Streptomyces sp. TaxID=1931 RepID=UPI002D32E772|nr:DUF3040 domain-containing protein [Streptomyces sp.]HZF88845.1 DUF3040 domain-containing protein [Streptomyces sp.]
MSYSTDDQRILSEIERGLTRDDPALATFIDLLNEQFPHAADSSSDARASRRNPRVVTAVVLTVIALLALMLTAMLGSRSAPPAGVDGGPAALSSLSAVTGGHEGHTLP